MRYTFYSEPKARPTRQSKMLLDRIREELHIPDAAFVRVITCYETENATEASFAPAREYLFAQPVLCDITTEKPDIDAACFSWNAIDIKRRHIERYYEGCLNFFGTDDRASVRITHLVYVGGKLTAEQCAAIAAYLDEEKPPVSHFRQTDRQNEEDSATLGGFCAADMQGLERIRHRYFLSLSVDDLIFCQSYFEESAEREPTLMELRIINTLWNDRIASREIDTPLTELNAQDSFIKNSFETYLEKKTELLSGYFGEVTLRDIVDMPKRYLKHLHFLDSLSVFEDADNAAIRVEAKSDTGESEPWYLHISCEEHHASDGENPPAAANWCTANATWDALAARSYVFGAMYLGIHPYPQTENGAFLRRETESVADSVDGYQMYADGSGFPTPLSDVIFDRSFGNSRYQLSAIVSAARADQVVRKGPIPGDCFVLVYGGRTELFSGTAQEHSVFSSPLSAQRLQRVMHDPNACRLLKRCMKCKSGGILKTVCELAPGARLNLDRFPYETDVYTAFEMLTYSSVERMVAITNQTHVRELLSILEREQLFGVVIGGVIADKILRIQWHQRQIAALPSDFLRSGGMPKSIEIEIPKTEIGNLFGRHESTRFSMTFRETMLGMLSDINVANKAYLLTKIGFSVGGGTLFAPFCGEFGLDKPECMMIRLPLHTGISETAAVAAWGFMPIVSAGSTYHGVYYAAVMAASKLIAAGQSPDRIFLSPISDFPRTRNGQVSYADVAGAALGLFQVQMDLGCVLLSQGYATHAGNPDEKETPLLTVFALSASPIDALMTAAFTAAGKRVYLLTPRYDLKTMLPDSESQRGLFAYVHELIRQKKVSAVYPVGQGGIGGAVCRMSFPNKIGFNFSGSIRQSHLWERLWGSFLVETDEVLNGELIGDTKDVPNILIGNETVELDELMRESHLKNEAFYRATEETDGGHIVERILSRASYRGSSSVKYSKPRVFIPSFLSNQTDYDLRRSFEKHGAQAKIVRFGGPDDHLEDAVEAFLNEILNSQMLVLSEQCYVPDGYGAASSRAVMLLSDTRVRYAMSEFLLKRDGLILGVGGGFNALVQAGMFGRGDDGKELFDRSDIYFSPGPFADSRSHLVCTRPASCHSPWLTQIDRNEVYGAVYSMGCGRLHFSERAFEMLKARDMIASQFINRNGDPSLELPFNPPLSEYAVESLVSCDGRILGKLCHFEATVPPFSLFPGCNPYQPIIDGGVKYFQ